MGALEVSSLLWPEHKERHIARITVSGFKSIASEQSIDIRPLTILAGANSSGKSSIMQPLLLLKQTLESGYDPGPLLLGGDNIKFTSVDQFLSKGVRGSGFSVGIHLASEQALSLEFADGDGKGLRVRKMLYSGEGLDLELSDKMSHSQLVSLLPDRVVDFVGNFFLPGKAKPQFQVTRDRCFLNVAVNQEGKEPISPMLISLLPTSQFAIEIGRIVHLPGLRGNPRRAYPKTAVGATFSGVFQDYGASIIAQWHEKGQAKLRKLGENLARLGLTWKVIARPIDQTQVQLLVGRLTRATQGGAWDLVDIADVGFGVSQVLPVLVALLTAKPGQLVYLEQPEIHLHPRAQVIMAQLLIDAANRGVRVVAETHSQLLLLGVQTAVARGDIRPEKVKLNWFERDADGLTKISSADLDESGAFGEEWPEDFAETELKAQDSYLDAAEAKHQKG